MIVERIAQAIEADRGSLWLEGGSGRRLQTAASFGFKDELSSRWKREVLAARYGPLCHRVSLTGKPLLVPDAQTATFGLEGPVGCFGDQAVLVVPVAAGGLTVGAMVFSRLVFGAAFSEEDGVYAATLASQAALITLLPSAVPDRPSDEPRIYGASLAAGLASQLVTVVADAASYESLITEMTKLAAEVFRATGCWVMVWDTRRQEFRVLNSIAGAGPAAKLKNGAILKPAKAVETLLERPTASIGDLTRELSLALFPLGARVTLGTDLVYAIPVVAQRELVGALLVGNDEEAPTQPPASVPAITALLAAALTGHRYREEGRQERSQLRSVLSCLPDGLLAVNAEERVVLYNRRAEELLGRRASEVFGQPLSMVLSLLLAGASDPDHFLAEFREALQQTQGVSVLTLEVGGATPKRLSLRVFGAEDEAGQRLGWGVVVQEAEGGRAGGELGTDVVGGLSQELRTPLATIKGCTTTLLSNYVQWEEDTAREFIGIIDFECDRLHSLVENVFEASRIASGSLVVRRQPCSLQGVIEAVLSEFQGEAGRIEVDVAEDLPRVLADPSRLGEVLRNLIENAVKFSPPDSSIVLRAHVLEGEVWVSVMDEGLGIAPEHHEKVFERFFCVGSPTSKPSEGIGLGLSIARSIVEAHKGRIWVESALGKGSCFTFALPLSAPVRSRSRRAAPAPVRVPADRRDESTPRTRAGRTSRRPSVLVVDDETRVLRFIRANLEAGGYRVIVATDGATAIQLMEAEEPDLVLLDLMLPDIDGFEVCQRIRQFSVVPVIMITARSDEADRIRGLNLGADDYLTKPFSPDELMARVGAVMRRTRFADEMEPRPTLLCGDLAINFAQRRVSLRGSEVRLSPTEYKLLYELSVNAGRVLSHEDLLQRVWGPQYRNESAYLWTYVRHLRRKLEDRPESPKYILTEPGVGYLFALPA